MAKTGRQLADENYARWQMFYKKGLISRRTMLKAAMVWAGAGTVGSVLAACGGDDDDDSPGAVPTATTAGAAPTATTAQAAPTNTPAAPAMGGTLRVALAESDLPTMDPHMHNLRTGIITFYHMFDNLGVRNQETLVIEPWLAESWEVVEPTRWRMKLREGVKFHDGSDFTGATVKWNWERITNPEQKSPQMANQAAVAGVELIDDYTIDVITHNPYPIFTERLQNFQMISEKVAEKGDEFLAENPIGTGPYKFVEWKKGQEIVMTANTEYWNPDVTMAYTDVILRIIPGVPTQLAELLAETVDIIRVVPFDQMQAVTNSGVATPKVQPILRVQFVRLDAKGRGTPDNPFTDVRVRNAANHALDIDTYIETLQAGGDRTPAMVNPKHFGFDPTIEPHTYDPDLAKQLLAEAGYADGFTVKWMTGASLMPNATQVEQAMQRDLAAVGINTELNYLSDGNLFTTLHNEGKGDPMMSYSWGSYSVFDTDGIYWDMFHSDSIFSYYNNPEFDALIEEARGIMDSEKRKELYSQAQRIIRDEAPVLFMWGLHTVWGVSNKVDWSPAPDEIDRYFWAKPA
ncbi:MAG: hypothetical protein DCC58_00115 [Chloroflexi bacterium]|nr:MAG: hypothetical protein DCC58_00115 [Chloroflexota bacterium]